MFYAILIGLALGERLVFDLGPNVELVTMSVVMVGIYGSTRFKWLVPMIVMAVSDLVLGWGLISVFTWTGFLAMVYLPKLISRVGSVYWRGLAVGWLGVVLFYFWTNGGVWLTDQWGMYSRDLHGLMQCYINGLPFLKMQLASVLLTVPLAIYIYETINVKVELVEMKNFTIKA